MADMQEVKRLVEDQGRVFDEFKKANDALIAAKADGKAIGDLEARVAALNDKLTALDEIKSKVDAVETKLSRPGALSGGDAKFADEFKSFSATPGRRGQIDEQAYLAYKGALNAFVRARGNSDLMQPAEVRAMQAGIDPDGGYLLPTPAVASIVQKVREFNVMRSLAGSVSISTNAIEGLVDRNDAAAAWVGEVSSRPETDTPQIQKDRIEVFEVYSFPFVSQQLLEDAAVDVEGWLVDRVSTAFAEAEELAFVSGNGVTRPRGFTTYTTAATGDSSRAWGQMQHVNTGANGAFHTTKADPLIDLISAFKPGYLTGASWVMSRAALALIRKLKESTSDRYLWEPSMQVGVPSSLLGYPVQFSENMPAPSTTGALGIALGDFRRGYLIVDRIGISVLRDPYTSKPRVGLYVRKRVGGAVRDFDAIKFLRFSA